MDIKILNGDISVDERGIPELLSEDGEILQRALLRLRVPKGSFLHDTDFGSRFFEIDRTARENADALAFLFARQALSPLEGKLTVKSANALENGAVTVRAVLNSGTEAEFTV